MGAFVGDGQDPLDLFGVGGLPVGGEAEHGPDGGHAGVAGPDGVASVVFEVVQEGADEAGVEVFEIEARRRLAGALLGTHGRHGRDDAPLQ